MTRLGDDDEGNPNEERCRDCLNFFTSLCRFTECEPEENRMKPERRIMRRIVTRWSWSNLSPAPASTAKKDSVMADPFESARQDLTRAHELIMVLPWPLLHRAR